MSSYGKPMKLRTGLIPVFMYHILLEYNLAAILYMFFSASCVNTFIACFVGKKLK